MNPARESIATESFGPYEVYERLGMGGMASVHRAKKRGPAGFERTVALKRMLSHLTEDRGFIESFVREAKVASLLAHPNIAQTYDFGRINGVFYIAMELVQGYDVRKLLRQAHKSNEPIPLPVVISLLGELCDALDYAHSFVDENGQPMHIVHRDVSPSNMIVSHTGHLKVIDFGIAKANSRQLHTETGTVKGKLGYMAPETALGLPVSPVSDIFSVGVVGWELVTAMPLFSARTDFETMRKLREEQVAPPSTYNPACPPMLDQLILAALHREQDHRLQSARSFRATLDGICQQFGISTSARAVADWMRNAVPPEEGPRASFAQAPSSAARALPLPAAPETRMSRPSASGRSSALLRRSQDQIQLATEIWGEDNGTQGASDSGMDFSMSMSGQTSGHGPEALPYTPLGLSVPSLAPQSVPQPLRPSMGMVHHSGQMPGPNVHTANGPQIHTANVPSVKRSKAPLFALAGLAIVAGILGGILYARRAPEAAPNAHVHFSVKPDGSTIEVAGQVLETGVMDKDLSPGGYSITIKHDGYKTQTISIALENGKTVPIAVALEKDDAVAAAPPQPAVQAPLPVQPAQPVANTQPAVDTDHGDDQGTEGSTDHGTHVTRPSSHNTDKKHHGTTVAQVDKGNGATTGTGSATQEAEVKPDPKPDPVVTKPDPVQTKPDPVVTKPDPKPVTKPDPVPDNKPKTTPVVAATAVTKLSGDTPMVHSDTGGTFTAKVCIDEQGHVSSVKVLGAAGEAASEFQRGLMTWRFRPYVNKENKISPVCFVESLRVLTK